MYTTEVRNTSSSPDNSYFKISPCFFPYFPQISILSCNLPFWMSCFYFLVNVLTQMNILYGKTVTVTTCKHPYADTSLTNLLSCYSVIYFAEELPVCRETQTSNQEKCRTKVVNQLLLIFSCYHSWRIAITYLLHTSLCRGRTLFVSTDDWWVDRRRTEPHSLLIQSTWSEEISITTYVYTVLNCSCHLKTQFIHNSSAEKGDKT